MRRVPVLGSRLTDTVVMRVGAIRCDDGGRMASVVGVNPGSTSEIRLIIGESARLDRELSNRDVVVATMEDIGLDDVILLLPGGDIVKLISGKDNEENTLVVTNSCNLNCRMCPQLADDGPLQHAINITALKLAPVNLGRLGLTGGEPTLHRRNFIEILKVCRERFDGLSVSVLSNGVALADLEYVGMIASEMPYRTTFHIPLYGDNPILHDGVVRGNGFYRTLRGLYNLYSYGIEIEIRVVILRENISRLRKLAVYIATMLPFVRHVAIMGLELEGAAAKCEADIWVDPGEFMDELGSAIEEFIRRRMEVSVYNLPTCVVAPKIRPYVRQSISKWKVAFDNKCSGCDEKRNCGGFFVSDSHRFRNLVTPITRGN